MCLLYCRSNLSYNKLKPIRINDSIRSIRPTFAAMKFSWLLCFLLVLAVAFTSCEKEIDIPLSVSDPKLVVEGSIANDQQPIVVLTESMGFFDRINRDNINFISDADVWVTDLTTNKKVKLTPITIDFLTAYTILNSDPLYNDFKTGITEHAYKLEITYKNELYTSVAKVPASFGYDSLYFEPQKSLEPEEFFQLKGILTDPDTLGNYYKYFTRRNGNGIVENDFFESFASRFDDTYFNGQTLPADLFLGFDRSDTVDSEFNSKRSYSQRGDTIIVKLTTMQLDVYDFWKTLDFAEGSVGNPFASPIQVQTNISNDAFGVWSGFGNHYDTIINKP